MPYFMEVLSVVCLLGVLVQAYWSRRDHARSAIAWGDMLEKQRQDALAREREYWVEAKRLVILANDEMREAREQLSRLAMYQSHRLGSQNGDVQSSKIQEPIIPPLNKKTGRPDLNRKELAGLPRT